MLKLKLKSKINWSFFLFLAVAALFSWLLMSSTFGYEDGKILIDSKLWSDFGAHLPLIRSFSKGSNFPVEYPQFANQPIRYHYLFYLLAAGLEKLGLNIALSLNIVSALGLTLLLVMIYCLTRLVSRSKLAGWLAAVLFLFNGSLTFVDYFQTQGWSLASLLNIVNLKHFVNFGPWSGDVVSAFWNWNILTNQRHLPFGFGLALLLIWPLVKAVFDEDKVAKLGWLWLIWPGLILLPFFHQAAYVMAVMFIVLWFVLNPKLLKSYGWLYSLGLLYSLPGFYYFLNLSSSSLHFKLGFLAADQTWLGMVQYWVFNLGLYLTLLLLLPFLVDAKQRKLWLVFLSYFVLANTIQLSPDMINNHKLINFLLVGLAILTASFMIKAWKKSWSGKILVILWLPLLVFSGLVDAFPVINDHWGSVEDVELRPAATWIVQNTPKDSVFVVTDHFYNPVLLAGRKTWLDYGYFAWSLGYDTAARRSYLKRIFAPEQERSSWCKFMKEQDLDFLLLNLDNQDFAKQIDLRESWLIKNQQSVFSFGPDESKVIFSVKEICLL